jgi:hypothetical protein
MGTALEMTDIRTKRHVRRITRPADVEQVVGIADLYATEACRLHLFVDGEELHKAMSGAFLMFLTDVAQSEA